MNYDLNLQEFGVWGGEPRSNIVEWGRIVVCATANEITDSIDYTRYNSCYHLGYACTCREEKEERR